MKAIKYCQPTLKIKEFHLIRLFGLTLISNEPNKKPCF